MTEYLGAPPPPAVLVVTDVYPPGCGGSGWSTHALVSTLQQRGHEVRVVELDPGHDRSSERDYDGVPVRTVGLKQARASVARRFGAHDYSFEAVRQEVAEILRASPGIALVHGQHLHSGPGAVAAAVAANRAAVLTLRDHWPVCLHGTAWWGGDQCSGCTAAHLVGCMKEVFGVPAVGAAALVPWARRRLQTRVQDIARAHRVIAVSATLRDRLRSRGAEIAIEVVPNIVDPERSARSAAAAAARDDPAAALPDEYLFGAGKLTPPKGFDGLLDVLAAADTQLPLVLAGTGAREEALRRRAAAAGLDVRLLGWVDGPALLRLMQAARAVVLPSLVEEALARVLLESMSVGTPVISWPVGSSREVIEHGRNGWLVSDGPAMAAALDDVANPDRRNAIAGAARQTAVERFAPDAVYPRIAAVYRDAVAEAQRG